jgi:FdhD protein
VRHCGSTDDEGAYRNAVCVDLAEDATVDLGKLQRNFYMTSSCGVCGKAALDAIRVVRGARDERDRDETRVSSRTIAAMPDALRAAQSVFERTGGLHAAGLFGGDGALLAFREDVGRHNAVDKIVGAELFAGRLPLRERVLVLSGRASFELLQKAILAGAPIVAAVGAPSSLAVELANDAGVTLAGFVRDGRLNVYAGAERIEP